MKRSYSGYLYIVLCAVIFSTMEVMLKTVHGVFAPMQITCLRFLIGGLLLIPFALRSMKKKGAAFTRADVGFFALTGFLCVAFSMVLYQMAVTHTKASVVAVIFSCNPIFHLRHFDSCLIPSFSCEEITLQPPHRPRARAAGGSHHH